MKQRKDQASFFALLNIFGSYILNEPFLLSAILDLASFMLVGRGGSGFDGSDPAGRRTSYGSYILVVLSGRSSSSRLLTV